MTYLLITLLTNLLLLLFFNNIKKFISLYDTPDKKLKMHKHKVPLLGGIFIIFNYLVFLAVYLITETSFITFSTSREYLSIFLFVSLFFLVGLYDDKYNSKPFSKILILTFISIVVVLINNNLIIKNITLSFYDNNIFLFNFSIFFTVFSIIILVNSLNFYDGINGQSILFFIAIFSFLYLSFDHNLFYLLNVIILSMLLILNIKNKLFLGDSGIYLLSAVLSFSLLYEYNVNKNFIRADDIFILLMLPGFDLVRLSLTRILNGKNAFVGDRNHIHHLLNNKFSLLTTNFILIIMFALPIFFKNLLMLNNIINIFIFLLIYCILIILIQRK
tara:strand:+ start:197 stop:1189 length:993 start_codon:yes stop_codon:yes gene_type:complete